MKKLYKKMMATVLAVLLTVTAIVPSVTVKADRIDADPEYVYVSLGADLSASQRATVLDLLGITEEDLEDYTLGQITNSDEHRYLGSYLDASVIGSAALSSVIVICREEGSGITVDTHNITYCTPGMYTNALITAGISDAEVIVAGPFNITGTAALVGAMKAYGELTGEDVSEESMDAAMNELVITGEIAESVGESQEIEELIAFIKAKVVEKDLKTDEDIAAVIDEGAEQLNITLTEEEKQAIISLMKKIKGLNLDLDAMKGQAEDLFNKLEGMGIDMEAAGNFFTKIWEAVVDFFKNLFS